MVREKKYTNKTNAMANAQSTKTSDNHGLRFISLARNSVKSEERTIDCQLKLLLVQIIICVQSSWKSNWNVGLRACFNFGFRSSFIFVELVFVLMCSLSLAISLLYFIYVLDTCSISSFIFHCMMCVCVCVHRFDRSLHFVHLCAVYEGWCVCLSRRIDF